MTDKQLQNWLKSKTGDTSSDSTPLSGEEQKELDRFDRIWEAAAPTASKLEVDTDAAWNRMDERLFGEEPVQDIFGTPRKVVGEKTALFVRTRKLARVAAIGIFLITLGTLAFYAWSGETAQHRLAVSTAAGETENVLLPDGTSVTINQNSTFAYEATSTSRNVTLTGEAYFDVARDENLPFTITTGELQTRVLGTSFNVRAYPDEVVEVAVTSGRVEVSDADEEVVLKPNELVTYVPAAKKLSATQTNEVKAEAWAANELIYQDASLREMLPALERFYQRKFVVRHAELLNCPLTAKFERQDLEKALTLLEFQFGEVLVEDQQITLTSQGCN